MLVNAMSYVSLAACFATFLPTILNWKLDSLSEIYISSVFSSNGMNLTLIICLSMLAPTILNMVLLSLSHKFHAPRALQIMWILLMSVALPLLISFALISHTQRYHSIVMSLIHSQRLMVMSTTFSMLNVYGCGMWKMKFLFPCMIFISLYHISAAIISYTAEDRRQSVRIVSNVSFFCAVPFFSWNALKWIRFIWKKINKGNTLSGHDYYDTWLMLAIACVVVITVMKKIILIECSEADIESSLYLITCYVVLVSLLIGHNVIRELLVEKVHRENQVKEMVTGFFSHEVRSPLNAATMGLQILQREVRIMDVSSAFLETVSDVEESLSSVVDVLNDLITYERLASLADDLSLVPVQIMALFRTKFIDYENKARKRGIEFALHWPEDGVGGEVMVKADEEKVLQVVRHLMLNALDSAGPNGKVDVTVSVQFSEDICSISTVCLKVMDSGKSINEGFHGILDGDGLHFSPGVIEAGKDMTLRFMISSHIAQLHGGTLEYFPSSTFHGRWFQLTLPVTTTCHRVQSTLANRRLSGIGLLRMAGEKVSAMYSESSDGHPKSILRNKSVSKSKSVSMRSIHATPNAHVCAIDHDFHASADKVKSSNMSSQFESMKNISIDVRNDSKENMICDQESMGRVLVVDDVLMNRKMLCKLLDGQCDISIVAENGQIAVERMRASMAHGLGFDLVLMDYQMPVMDGPTAARAMRDMGYRGPIIGVTGNVLAVHTEVFLSHGANAVLPKPLNFEALLKAIRANSLPSSVV